MALALTAKVGTVIASGTGGASPSAFSVSAGAIIYVAVGGGFAGTSTWSPTLAGTHSIDGAITFTQVTTVSANASNWTSGIRTWQAVMTSAGNVTITADHGATNVNAYYISALHLTGQHATQNGATATDGNMATNGADSLTLSGSPASDSYVIAWLGAEMDNTGTWGALQGSDFTELQEFGSGSDYAHMESQYRTGSTSTTVGWQDTQTGAGSVFRIAGATIEVIAAAGGTEYTQGVAGTLTSVGTAVKSANTTKSGALTSAGTVVKSTAKGLAGALSLSGTLATIKTTLLSLAGILTSAGELSKQTAVTKGGGLTTGGTLSKYADKILMGILSSAGDILKQTGKSLTGDVSPSGSLSKLTTRLLAGGLTLAGAMTAVKTALLTISGSISLSGDISRQTGKGTFGTIGTVGTLQRLTQKGLAGVLAAIGTASKQASIGLTGVLSSAGTLAWEIATVIGLINLTARARSFSLTVLSRDSLTAQARDFSLTVQERVFNLTAKVRSFSLTAKDRD